MNSQIKGSFWNSKFCEASGASQGKENMKENLLKRKTALATGRECLVMLYHVLLHYFQHKHHIVVSQSFF